MISAVLLAAGESRRMGKFKQLLPFAGKTFVECCVDNLLASHVDEVVVITGHREADVRHSIGQRPVRLVYNPDYRSGMSASIKRGVEVLSQDARAVLIALVDQPQIESGVFNQVVHVYERDQALIVVPTYNRRKGHPIVLDLRLKDEILAMDPNEGLRQVVNAHQDRVVLVPFPSDAVLIDFDRPEDYQRLSNP